MYTGYNMAGKLYWRIKKNGKWTWKPAKVLEEYDRFTLQYEDVLVVMEEE